MTRTLTATLLSLLLLPGLSLAEQRPWLLSNIGPDGGEPLLDVDGNPLSGELLVMFIRDVDGDGPDPAQTEGPDIGHPAGDDLLYAEQLITTPLAGIHPAGAISLQFLYDGEDFPAEAQFYVRVFEDATVDLETHFANSLPFGIPEFPAIAQTVLEFPQGLAGYLGNEPPVLSVPTDLEPVAAGSMVEFDVSATDSEPVSFSVHAADLPGGAESVQVLDGGDGTATIRWAIPPGAVGTFPVPVLAYDGELFGAAPVVVTTTTFQLRPGAFLLTGPVDGGTAFEGTRLTWQPSVHPTGQDITYTVFWDDNPEMDSPESVSDIVDPRVDVFYTDPPARDSRRSRLQPEDGGRVIDTQITIEAADGDVFYWRVRAVAADASGRFSTVSSAIAERPDAPVAGGLLEPTDGAALTTTAPLFRWEAATDSDIGDTLTYDLRWSIDGGAHWDTVRSIPTNEFDMAGEVFHLAGAGALRDWIEDAAIVRANAIHSRQQGLTSPVKMAGTPTIDATPDSDEDEAGAGIGRLPSRNERRSRDLSARRDDGDRTPTVVLETRSSDWTSARSNRGDATPSRSNRHASERSTRGLSQPADTFLPMIDDVPDNSTVLWTIDAVDATGLRATATESREFTVDAPSSPTPFDIVFPADSVWVRHPGTIPLQWTMSFDADPEPLTYDVLATFDPAITDPVDFPVVASGLVDPAFELSSDDDLAWRWTVRAVEDGDTTWMRGGPARLYVSRQDAPSAFERLIPADGATIADLTPAFAWEESFDSDLADSLSYTVSWSIDGWVTVDSVAGLVVPSLEIDTPLPDESEVVWRVRAVDTNTEGTAASNGEGSFTIHIDDAPSDFALSYPGDGETVLNPTAVFAWEPSFDPDEAGDVTYTLYIGDDDQLLDPEVVEAGADTAVSYEVWTLGVGQWYWQVVAEDATGMSNVSETWMFELTAAGVASLMDGMPTEYAITRTYPNPFNPVVSVVLAVPRPGERLTVAVHDILGREVAQRRFDGLSPGYHTVALDLTGHASGLYFVRFAAAGNRVETRRVTLLK